MARAGRLLYLDKKKAASAGLQDGSPIPPPGKGGVAMMETLTHDMISKM
jgi:hypothetical protein